MPATPQNFGNHAKMVPAYHYIATPLFLVVFLWFGYRTATDFTPDRLFFQLFLVYVLIVGAFTRLFPLGVQDRVIRLEERLRLERVLDEELRARIHELDTKQLVALRFASDAEVGELTRRVLAGEFADARSIKRAVTQWRADHQRI
jgi:small-conductance mechanosensitive channel